LLIILIIKYYCKDRNPNMIKEEKGSEINWIEGYCGLTQQPATRTTGTAPLRMRRRNGQKVKFVG